MIFLLGCNQPAKPGEVRNAALRCSDISITGELKMLNFKTVGLAISAAALSLGLAAAPAFAQDSKDTMSKDSMSKDSMGKDSMAKDSMAKDSMAKDSMKKDSMAKDSMSKDSMKKDTMSKDSMSKDTMSKDAPK